MFETWIVAIGTWTIYKLVKAYEGPSWINSYHFMKLTKAQVDHSYNPTIAPV